MKRRKLGRILMPVVFFSGEITWMETGTIEIPRACCFSYEIKIFYAKAFSQYVPFRMRKKKKDKNKGSIPQPLPYCKDSSFVNDSSGSLCPRLLRCWCVCEIKIFMGLVWVGNKSQFHSLNGHRRGKVCLQRY
ncbi:hypothetical protein CEXT_215331 [Caerostris extrusa]|uniref:Secreted protein n=1 Tax=Caerostris extrusa TaxID=172846 RepID=A0AAV4WN17_CAEEX|nr:hypothetical protein CEXT_215331 [Caerostris extrusa]